MSKTSIDTSAPIMVTGATGFVAGWIVKDLLEAGATVHAPVRDPSKTEKLKHLEAVAKSAAGTLKLFKADLLEKGSYAAAMQGCEVVYHTASPFFLDVKDPQTELVDPALEGTRNILETVNQTESVKRVVVTSSCAAIYTDAIDTHKLGGRGVTEADWNTTASLTYQPYAYSKTVAERLAWEMAENQTRWKLVTINPAMVLGPAIGGKPTSESFNIMRQAGDGTYKMGAPRLGWAVVDVRDLSQAHLAAGFLPEANGRNIVFGHISNILDTLLLLQNRYGSTHPLPKRALPKWLLWLVGPSQGLSRRFVTGSVNVEWKGDNGKGIRELGLQYRPLNETLEDMFQYMIEHGYFEK